MKDRCLIPDFSVSDLFDASMLLFLNGKYLFGLLFV